MSFRIEGHYRRRYTSEIEMKCAPARACICCIALVRCAGVCAPARKSTVKWGELEFSQKGDIRQYHTTHHPRPPPTKTAPQLTSAHLDSPVFVLW